MKNPLFDNLFGANAENDDTFLYLVNGKTITYKKFLSLSGKIANAFFDLGLTPGADVFLPNSSSPR